MASFFSLYLAISMAYTASFALASYPNFPPLISSISAAPEFQPSPSPSPSPDISPLYPTPGRAALPPSDQSSLPTIPSSPSPPNPDVMVTAPAPELPLPPAQSLPFSATAILNPGGFPQVLVVLLAVFAAVTGEPPLVVLGC